MSNYGRTQQSGYGQVGQGDDGPRSYGQSGYGQYNPYDQQDDAPASYGNTQPYSTRPEPQQHGSSNYGDNAGGYEMGTVNGQTSRSRDPNAILNECREIDRGIDTIDSNLAKLTTLHKKSEADTDTSANSQTNQEINRLNSDTMTLYRNFVNRLKAIKSNPDSGNPRNAPQVGRVDRRLKDAIYKYQQVDRDYRTMMKNQIARSYRIVRPDASDAEVQEAVEDTSKQQIFSQALLQSDRRGQIATTQQNVKNRHTAIQKIEQDMIQLAQMFQDMEALVVQQEPAVTQIEQKGEEVTENVGKANVEIDGAIKSARAARRKKWWCLLIALIIIIIIVVVVVVVVEVVKK